MDAFSGPTPQQLAATLSARIKTLINNDLKKICKEEGQTVSGNKVQLQTRIQAIINSAVARNDTTTLNRLRHRVDNRGEAPSPTPSLRAPATPTRPAPSTPTQAIHNGYSLPGAYSPYSAPPAMAPPRQIFRSSPFYEIRQLLLQDMTLEVSPSHRQNCSRQLTLSLDMCTQLKADPSLRLLLFSHADQALAPYTALDVAFPSQIEVKINGDEVKANFKGLKNKPGSTRPADITDYVRKTAQYRNAISITYALTQKKYNLYIYLVKKHSVDELAKRIVNKNAIPKQHVLDDFLRKARDPDIEVGSTNMSLKDPISTVRISIPCRSTICTHNQCFDAASFLQLQEQAPTWQCPVCNKTVSYEGLAVDQYVQEILDTVPKGTDLVKVEPDGSWSHGAQAESKPSSRNGHGAAAQDDSDDDIVEIPDYRVSAIKTEAVTTPLSAVRTPPLSSREASTAPRTGSKRSSEVIDLTLSDDDEPPRPAKKMAYSTPSSLPDSRRYDQASAYPSSSVPVRPPAQQQNGTSSGMRLDLRPPSHNHSQYGYRPAHPRPSYPGSGSYYGASP